MSTLELVGVVILETIVLCIMIGIIDITKNTDKFIEDEREKHRKERRESKRW